MPTDCTLLCKLFRWVTSAACRSDSSTHVARAAQAAPAVVGKKRKDPSILRSKPGSSKRICADRQAPSANGNAAKPPAKPSKGGRLYLASLTSLPVS